MNIRKIALDVLSEIIIDKGYSNIVLNKALNNLQEPDRGFLSKIVQGTLQNYFLLEHYINKVSRHQIKPKMKILLQMSLYQMSFMSKVPTYAIVSQAGDLARELDGEKGVGFANAVLRNLAKLKFPLSVEHISDTADRLSILYSTPRFIVKMWYHQFGEEECIKILKANQKVAPLSLRVDLNKISRQEILKNKEFLLGSIAPCAVIYDGSKKVADLEEFKKGYVVAQDEAGQLVAPMLELQPNDRILDMCAAPGSKTTHMASILSNQGEIIALDLHEHRVKLLEKGLLRLGYTNVKCLVGDATQHKGTYDKILLDAPCSGLGVIRRKPDILLNINPQDIDQIVVLQRQLLETAYRLLAPQGILVYSTCTINKKENNWMIDNFLRDHGDLSLIETKTLLPHKDDTDGFFIAKVKKNG